MLDAQSDPEVRAIAERASEATKRNGEWRLVEPMGETHTQLNIDNADSATYNLNNGGDSGGVREDVRRAADPELHGTSEQGIPERQSSSTHEGAGRDGRGDIPSNGVYELTEFSKNNLSQRGIESTEVRPSADKAAFSRSLSEARNTDAKNGWAVTPKTPEELGNCKTFLSDDGGVGFAISEDGDIEAVFRNRNKHPRGNAMKSAIPIAIGNGGRTLDCYGHNLVWVYERAGGMKPVCRVEFNPEYANDGWTPDKGEPYIYFMVATETDPDLIIANQDNHHLSTLEELDKLPTFGKDGYEDAIAYRNSIIGDMSGEQYQTTGNERSNFAIDDEAEMPERPEVRPRPELHTYEPGDATPLLFDVQTIR